MSIIMISRETFRSPGTPMVLPQVEIGEGTAAKLPPRGGLPQAGRGAGTFCGVSQILLC